MQLYIIYQRDLKEGGRWDCSALYTKKNVPSEVLHRLLKEKLQILCKVNKTGKHQ